MWRLFYHRFPFDPESLFQVPAASIASTLININGGRNGRSISFRDALVFKPPEKPVDLDDKFRTLFSRLKETQKPA